MSSARKMGGRKVNADSDFPEQKNKAEAEPPTVTENPLQRRTKITHHHPKFGLDGNEQKMDAEMDSVITNTGVSEKYTMKQEGTRGCPGKLYTNLDATQVMRTGEHAEGCQVDAHAFYHQQQLNELKRLVAGDLRPQEWLPATKIKLWNVHGVSVRTNNHLEGWHSRMNKRARKHHLGFYQFLQLILDEQGKTETVVWQIDDGYTHGRGSVRRSAAYGVQQRRVAALLRIDWFIMKLV
ncbi:hypothetical protein T08_2863 [Trichinella sp. T8]|nr:hypothetical protein T08_2863 [Trichinella sp. T8]